MIASLIAAVVLTGPAAFGDWNHDAPGVTRRITLKDLPAPGASPSGFAPPEIVKRPAGARLAVPPGFTVSAFAQLERPRQLRAAPNGDVFVAETEAGRIAVLRALDGAPKAAANQTFATGLDRPFGLAFYPPGPNPQWLYVANVNAVLRFPYRNGDVKPRGAAQVIVPRLAAGARGHTTRDVAFSPDGRWMYVSVGSGSNDAEGMPRKPLADAKAFDAAHGPGATWDTEADRADVLIMTPKGQGRRVLAAGLRNCVTMAVQPSGVVWCAVNERDGMGEDLPPDYVTRVRDHAFYGWPWFYLGDHPDPRHQGERPDLAGKVAVPDVLIQAHSAPLGMAFYTARSGPAAFPAPYRGDAFVALHGSWNRARRTGYKVVRLTLSNGAPTGEYQDFLTGFVAGAQGVWGRPVGVTVAHDGALLVSDDGGGIVWRVAASAK
ncbi:MAG TPA: PQQ-dependent sugar dehydrogenase [Caulobacteraceae bacterium]